MLIIAQDNPLIRPLVSLDFDDIVSLIIAVGALAAVFVVQKTRSESKSDATTEAHEVHETVDSSVLGKFQELMDRITVLEKDLAETRADLKQALREINELKRLEEYLQAKLHEKDAEIRVLHAERQEMLAEHTRLRAMLTDANERILHLEQVCQRHGLDGPDDL